MKVIAVYQFRLLVAFSLKYLIFSTLRRRAGATPGRVNPPQVSRRALPAVVMAPSAMSVVTAATTTIVSISTEIIVPTIISVAATAIPVRVTMAMIVSTEDTSENIAAPVVAAVAIVPIMVLSESGRSRSN
ncbi:MAG TPA: hypothetical protein VF290_17560 [Pyrinomonadaceae bacterium]